MSKHAVSFMELHNQLFMQGSNLGNKINAAQRGANLTLDTDLGVVWVQFKSKLSLIPLSNVASADITDPSALGFDDTKTETKTVPAAIARGRKAGLAPEPDPEFDPNDDAAAHRARVRAASANAFVPNHTAAQNDLLIQQARGQAMGLKASAQVATPTQPKEGASVAGKPKALSHAQLKAQVAAESKQ